MKSSITRLTLNITNDPSQRAQTGARMFHYSLRATIRSTIIGFLTMGAVGLSGTPASSRWEEFFVSNDTDVILDIEVTKSPKGSWAARAEKLPSNTRHLRAQPSRGDSIWCEDCEVSVSSINGTAANAHIPGGHPGVAISRSDDGGFKILAKEQTEFPDLPMGDPASQPIYIVNGQAVPISVVVSPADKPLEVTSWVTIAGREQKNFVCNRCTNFLATTYTKPTWDNPVRLKAGSRYLIIWDNANRKYSLRSVGE